MKYSTFGDLKYLHFDKSPFSDLVHGFFTRKGGVSPEPWSSLNLSESVGDSRENISHNRKLIFESLNRPIDSIFDVWQVHSTVVLCADNPRPLEKEHQKADAILTNNPKVTLLMRFADCVPILFFDPINKAIGIAHAGWIGTVNNIVSTVVEKMVAFYGSVPVNIIAGIGPSIGPDHYFVGNDVYEKARHLFADIHDEVFKIEDKNIRFNLWAANEFLLRKVGIRNIIRSNICTACDLENWFSHRAENGKTGRFAAIIALKD